MAPTAGTTKRARPAFSPPRPGKKSKANATPSVARKDGAGRVKKSTATNSVNGPNERRAGGKNGGSGASAQKMQKQKQKERRKAAAGTMRAILGEASDDEKDEEDEEGGATDSDDLDEAVSDSVVDEDEEEEDDNNNNNNVRRSIHGHDNTESQASSPEPEFMLAEVLHQDRGKPPSNFTNQCNSDFPVPLPLIHHILQSHFATPEKTSLSKDALGLLGKYVEAFVREGIHRCTLDRAERETAGGGSGDATDSGWLEVEDLERVGVQLCLDF
ncbi:uncharacterized protein A1O9_07033 [Exophiala aquamarina CBS 119918]|uniref:Uncharacterized protein n=1 Tax=Exophiala aquamarina CBS 119918 TaxID=1182545 RepID=A0A072PC39_9EURO|nr:uncharacterized protein A1O9_07033 [Exophiala aquamarina CBS 119918]KEF56843.1 hypothetical protein A1O9_07033 [Exophiala aquamarina CBS 119918]